MIIVYPTTIECTYLTYIPTIRKILSKYDIHNHEFIEEENKLIIEFLDPEEAVLFRLSI